MRSSSSLFGALLLAASTINAYYIDPVSCAPYIINIKNGMDGAFQLAAKASSTLVSGNTVVDTMANLILGGQGEQNAAKERLGKASQYNTVSLAKDKIAVYCDESRYTERRDGYAYDSDNSIVMDFRFDSLPCKSSSLLAYHWAKPPSFVETERSYITLCPSYLATQLFVVAPTVSGLFSNTLGILGGVATASLKALGHTHIDLERLFDVICLHEIMHTDATAIGQSRALDGLPSEAGQKKGYYWSEVRRIAQAGAGSTNAESLAYMALAINLHDKQQLVVGEDGMLSKA